MGETTAMNVGGAGGDGWLPGENRALIVTAGWVGDDDRDDDYATTHA